MEDPVQVIEAAGCDNLPEHFTDAEDFDGFVFEGQEDASDHASAAQPPSGKVTGVVEWHVNTDESGLMS